MSESPQLLHPITKKPFTGKAATIAQMRVKLPIFSARERIQDIVQRYQITLLVGETGCGKTTQVPQYILDLNPELGIACTQPRRVAAMSVSERVAEEMGVELGDEVGYNIRFDNKSSEKTVLKYMTDGMLLREAMNDTTLSKYSVVIIDEAHERTVDTDILLGCLKEILAKRPEMRVMVMSATLEHQKFQAFFPAAPVVNVSGRMYGVDLYFCRTPEANYVEAAIRTAIQVHLYEGEGDILMFLCGEDEIETAVERITCGIPMAVQSELKGAPSLPFTCLPLYSALPPGAQKKVFKPTPEGHRKIVIATNIAETSLTIDGVVFVIDCGFSKQKVYNPKVRVESLLVTPISRASAEQRCGRAGRTKHGKCFRMYTKSAFTNVLQDQTYPEILRCNLGSVVLDMKKMGIDDLIHFDFIDPPAPQTLMRALELLNHLGALNDDGELTQFGDDMSRFPVEPEMAAMLLHSPEYGCASEIAKLAAMMSIQQPYVNTYERRAQLAKEQWFHQTGDHLSLLSTYEAYEQANYSQDWCEENYLNARNMQQAQNVFRQIVGIMQRQLGLDMSAKTDADADDRKFGNHIRQAILAGYFTKVAMATPTKNMYQTLKDSVKSIVYPGSNLKHRPSFVVYNELVMTSNTYVRCVTSISDDWLIDACPSYFDLEDFDGLEHNTMKNLWRMRERRLAKEAAKQSLPAKRARVEDSDSD
jgi:pre-mRNA-splicing factor ATP-dependent RNA helicase DHX15/PRP43